MSEAVSGWGRSETNTWYGICPLLKPCLRHHLDEIDSKARAAPTPPPTPPSAAAAQGADGEACLVCEHLCSPQQSKQRPASEAKIPRHGVARAGASILERGRRESDQKCFAPLHVTVCDPTTASDFFPSDVDPHAREPRER
jgi:hypothetical protein